MPSAHAYERVLHKGLDIDIFVEHILNIYDEVDKRNAIKRIIEAERNLRGADYSSTLTDINVRDYQCRSERERDKLRRDILNELIKYKRLDNDDDISLGNGGAAPHTSLRQEHVVLYVIGPPASGKSGISNSLADAFGAYILDSDYAKRKLPEFDQLGGASLVHEESDAIVFSLEEGNLLQHCLSSGQNMVIPKIGQNTDSIVAFSSKLKKFGYKVFLISVDLDRAKATQRAYYRYVKTGRYVPLSLIFDGYGNEPTLNYFKIKQRVKKVFSGYAQISTDVEIGEQPRLIEQNNLPVLKTIYRK